MKVQINLGRTTIRGVNLKRSWRSGGWDRSYSWDNSSWERNRSGQQGGWDTSYSWDEASWDQGSSGHQYSQSHRQWRYSDWSSSSWEPQTSEVHQPVELVAIESEEEDIAAEAEEGDQQDQEEEIETPYVLPDIAPVKFLSEVSDCVESRVFQLPSSSIEGVCLINSRAVEGCPETQNDFDLELLKTGLRPCIAFDIFKTLIFPQSQADTQQRCIGLAKHRGELQLIHRSTAELLQQVSVRGFNCVAISFIGRFNHRPYVDALLESCLLALVPIIFVVFHRHEKAQLAKDLECVGAFDDQEALVTAYRRAGVPAIQVTRQFNLYKNTDQALEWIERQWNENDQAASSSGGKEGASVGQRTVRADP